MAEKPPAASADSDNGSATAANTAGDSVGDIATSAVPHVQDVTDDRIGRTFSKYRVLRRIGKGGMAIVYKAEDLVLKRVVAVKFLADTLLDRPKAVERFIREAQVAGRLNHPNIIAIHDVCKETDACYMVMEMVNPDSAGQRIRTVGPYYWMIATRIVLDCCAALKTAHDAGVIHRDIKPDNILFSSGGNVKLTDFGIVKTLDDDPQLTAAGHVVGTPLYMSPEQSYNSRNVDARSDLYSLGATYFALLTGRPPFQGHSVPEIMSHVRSTPAPDPREFINDIPEPCARLVLRLLSKDPAQRHKSADELLLDLETVLERVPRRQQSIFEMERELPQPQPRSVEVPIPTPSIEKLGSGGSFPPAGGAKNSDSGKNSAGSKSGERAPNAAPAMPGAAAQAAGGGSTEGDRDRTATASVKTNRRGLLLAGLLAGLGLGLLPWLHYRDTARPTTAVTGDAGSPAATAGYVDSAGSTRPSGPGEVALPGEKPTAPLAGTHETIKVGILHSLTGALAISERPLADASMLAVEELNAQGGVLGKKIEPLLLDGKSEVTSDSAFTRAAKRLVAEEKVSAVFGGFGSAGRKAITPYFVESDVLLFYPAAYEGLEESPNVIYTGATPNQFVIPAVQWFASRKIKRMFLIGTDGLRPRAIEAIVEEEGAKLGWKLAGSHFAPVGDVDFSSVIKKIQKAKPQLVISALVGDSSVTFIKQLHQAKVLPSKIPTLSFTLGESELVQLSGQDLTGHYVARAHFPGPDGVPDQESTFAKNFRTKYGEHRVVSDTMEAAYYGVYMWAAAVKAAGGYTTRAVRQVLRDQQFEFHGVRLRVDPSNQHMWKTFELGRIGAQNRIEILAEGREPLPPMPFPGARTRAEWNVFLDRLYTSWGNNWANPNKPSYGPAK